MKIREYLYIFRKYILKENLPKNPQSFHKNGMPAWCGEWVFHHGKAVKQNTWTQYDSKGRLLQEYNYFLNTLHGKCRFIRGIEKFNQGWTDDLTWTVGQVKMGERNGVWETYQLKNLEDRTGHLITREHFQEGELTETYSFDEGNSKEPVTYTDYRKKVAVFSPSYVLNPTGIEQRIHFTKFPIEIPYAKWVKESRQKE